MFSFSQSLSADLSEPVCPDWASEDRSILERPYITNPIFGRLELYGPRLDTNSYHWHRGAWFEMPFGYRNAWIRRQDAYKIINIEAYTNFLKNNPYKGFDPDTGEAVCQSVLDGTDLNCVPWNLFTEGAITSDQTDYLVIDLSAEGSTKLTNFSGFVSGDLTDSGVIVPGAGAGVQLVLGYDLIERERDLLDRRKVTYRIRPVPPRIISSIQSRMADSQGDPVKPHSQPQEASRPS